jgi:hypothetical protein
MSEEQKNEAYKKFTTPQSDKIKNTINEKVLNYNLDLKDNIDKIKKKADEYSRKEINLNFIDRFTRWIYTNDKHLAKIEIIQYIMFIALLYFYNPFNINTKYPAFTKLLILVVAFMYVMLFFFIKLKVENDEDVDLIDVTEKTTLVRFFSIIVFFILFMFAIKGVLWLFINTRLVNIFRHLMTTSIVIGVLGIIYIFMKKTINKTKNAPGKSFLKLLLKVVMYLPCLMVDAAEYIKFQYHLAPKPVWILLGMEAGLVGVWFLIPYLFDKLMNLSGTKLLNEPVNLNIETVVGNYNDTTNPNNSKLSLDQIYNNKVNDKAKQDIAQQPADTLDNAPDKKAHYDDPNVPKNKILAWIYNKYKHGPSLKISFSKHPQYADHNNDRFAYKYALSGWFYLNPQPPNTSAAYSRYTNILNYGKKINIEYNGKLNSLRVMANVASAGDAYVDASGNTYEPGNVDASGNSYNTPSNGKAMNSINNMSVEVYKTNDIMYQKWNNIVINYDAGDLDVFLNGVLVSSISGAVPYMSFDTIVAGANKGIMGGICNINYYTDPLSENTIRTTYKSLRIKNLPYV